MPEITIDAREVIEKEVVKSGTGAHVFVPKEWRGETVTVVRHPDPDD